MEPYTSPILMVSDLVVAGKIEELGASDMGKFVRGDVEVVPLPSRTFVPGQAVYLYYEVYHLFRNEVGQTHFQVDYAVRGVSEKVGARLLRGLGNLLGVLPEGEGVKVSYEHKGISENEPIHVALDLSETETKRLEISVTVQDLLRAGNPKQVKSVTVMIGEDRSAVLR